MGGDRWPPMGGDHWPPMGGETEISTNEQGNLYLSHSESGRIVGMIVPATHYLITLVLNGGYIIVILAVFMVQGPKKDYRIVHATNGQSTDCVTRSCSPR